MPDIVDTFFCIFLFVLYGGVAATLMFFLLKLTSWEHVPIVWVAMFIYAIAADQFLQAYDRHEDGSFLAVATHTIALVGSLFGACVGAWSTRKILI